jgi:hypothetical protein
MIHSLNREKIRRFLMIIGVNKMPCRNNHFETEDDTSEFSCAVIDDAVIYRLAVRGLTAVKCCD